MPQASFPPPADTYSFAPITSDVLNPAQYAAVTHGQGPILVVAGAGSGKTRTLVYRMAWLIQQGVEPESILLLTFTRRAAQEMLGRAGQLTGQSGRRVIGGTFHATANALLRRYGHHLGLDPNFTIIDRADAEGIINLLKSSLGLGGAGKRFPSKRLIMGLISGAVNKAAGIEELIRRDYIHLVEFTDDIYTIREHYQQFKREHGLLDYDDLLVSWKLLLTESEPARSQLSRRFQYILVDEYQDTNKLQAEIVRLLAYHHSNVMVVGDDAQAIYSFRGADFQNIISFADQFPGARMVKLEENYRSTEPILQLTNAIIANAGQKFTKTLFTRHAGGVRPLLIEAPNEGAEARFIAAEIQKQREEGIDAGDIAVLFRSGYHSYKLEIELASRNIDFDKRGGLKLTESAHIKDLLSFFRVLVNPWDTLSWNRILLQVEKVGPKTAQKILQKLREADTPLEALAAYQPAPSWKAQFASLCTAMLQARCPGLSPSEQFDLLMAYYEPVFEKMYYDDYPKRRKDLDQLKALIAGYADIQSFVDDTALDPPDIEVSGHGREEGRLVLSTVHSAKGLEWDTVFVMGLADGRFPHKNTLPGEQWEEERRLLYVAATRAKRRLFLSYPREMVTADRQRQWASMSPFLHEISPNLYVKNGEALPSGGDAPLGRGFVNSGPSLASARVTYAEGMSVSHAFFGVGTVVAVPGPRQVEILFDRHGRKTLHLDYARLEILA